MSSLHQCAFYMVLPTRGQEWRKKMQLFLLHDGKIIPYRKCEAKYYRFVVIPGYAALGRGHKLGDSMAGPSYSHTTLLTELTWYMGCTPEEFETKLEQCHGGGFIDNEKIYWKSEGLYERFGRDRPISSDEQIRILDEVRTAYTASK